MGFITATGGGGGGRFCIGGQESAFMMVSATGGEGGRGLHPWRSASMGVSTQGGGGLHPGGGWADPLLPQWNIVNKRAVGILMECILVQSCC